MSKDRLAKVVTIAIMLAVPAVFAIRKTGARFPQPRADASPQDTIYGMLADAKKGDTQAYLARYTGETQAALKQTVAEKTEAGFRTYLQSSNAEIKGVAVQEPKALSDREVEVRLEYVYQDRNETQKVYLEKTSAGWRIARVESVERVKTLVPYGTPVQ
jgi:phage replication-related protein YjqB (UPF0714/DUF867 family)